jgi:ATP-dependent protease ClpP protease subunit
MLLPLLAILALVGGTVASTPAKSNIDLTRSVVVNGPILIQGQTNPHGVAKKIYALSNQDVTKPITVFIDSPGGVVFTGSMIAEAIDTVQNNGTPVRCISTGFTMSMAATIFVICDLKYAYPTSRILFHYPYQIGPAGKIIDPEMAQRYLEFVATKVPLPIGLLQVMMEQEAVLTAEEFNLLIERAGNTQQDRETPFIELITPTTELLDAENAPSTTKNWERGNVGE